jgi:predicted cupin superfamily sugar epimerase
MSEPLTAAALKKLLRLEPHPREGGWFRQTWRAQETIAGDRMPPRYVLGRDAGRAAGTAIYYLLEPDTFSEMHRLSSDEVFHFYLGDPVEMLQLFPDSTGRRLVLGSDIAGGELVQTVIQHGVWQGSRLVDGGQLALLGCTVSPGFEYADYESAGRAQLTREFPDWAEMIGKLTRS